MARYAKNKGSLAKKKSGHSSDLVSIAKLEVNERHCELGHERRSEKNCHCFKGARTEDKDSEHSHSEMLDRKQDTFSHPPKIVILKPDPESTNIRKSSVGSSEVTQDVSREDFLEEVKESLRFELQEKAGNTPNPGRSGVQASPRERPSDPKLLGRNIAKHIKDSVSRDLGTMLARSESNMPFSNTAQFSGKYCHINRAKLVSEKHENVFKAETDEVKPSTGNVTSRLSNLNKDEKHENVFKAETDEMKSCTDNITSGLSCLNKDKVRSKLVPNFPKSRKIMKYWEDKNAVSDWVPRPLEHEQENKVRSSSAPQATSASTELPLEGQDAMPMSQIHKKLEQSEENCKVKSKNRNFRCGVSNLRRNINLKSRFFGKKTQSLEKSADDKSVSVKVTSTAVADVMDFRVIEENSTAMPPSPTSLSSSSREESFGQDHPSSESMLEVIGTKDIPPQGHGELSTNFQELMNPSEQFENDESEIATTEEYDYEDSILEEIGDSEPYIKAILLISGLYDSLSSYKEILRWDAATNAIPHYLFEEVEAAYSKYEKVDNYISYLNHAGIYISRKMLFDLSSEALPCVLGAPFTTSKLKSWSSGQITVPQGENLLDDLWHQIQVYTKPVIEEPQSVEELVDSGVKNVPWCSILHEDIDRTVMEMELVIIEELINEFLHDMFI